MQWQLLKLFPQCFGAGRSDEEFTETEWRWLQCHCWLDAGIRACPECGDLGVGGYCGACGADMTSERQRCDACQTPGAGAYCRACGHALRSPVADRIELGTFDWHAWAQSLTPFLGGFTPRELTLLERG
jgi:hypothetical protein